MHGLGAERCEIVALAELDAALPERQAVVRRDLDLVAHLAGEADPEQSHAISSTFASRTLIWGKASGSRSTSVDQFRDQVARARPGKRDRRPLLGDRRGENLELRPFGLQPLLQPGEHARRTARRGAHEVVVFAEPRGDAIVEHHAVLAEHQAIAAAADRELGPGVGVDAVQEFGDVPALQVDLAEGRGIEHADRGGGSRRPRDRPQRSCPRRVSGSTGGASTGRHPRTRRRWPRARDASRFF